MKITETLTNIITEQTRLDLLIDKLTKPVGDNQPLLTVGELIKIVAGDPKTIISGFISNKPDESELSKIKKVGPYSQWLIKQFILGKRKDNSGEFAKLFFEDLYKVTDDLKKFDRFKERIPEEDRDINKLTIEQLYELTKEFSLEKTKASADEKNKAKETYEHPGADVVYRGNDWTVVKISDKSQLGKDAACFYGGNNQETRWCTSAPGLSYFNQYIEQGPLYVILSNNRNDLAKSGLPTERYQFHFESNQFMDIADRQVDLVDIFNDKLTELKDFFKVIFKNYLQGADKLDVEVRDNDTNSKFIGIYGFNEFIEMIPKKVKKLIINTSNGAAHVIPDTIGDFKEMTILAINGGVSALSPRIGECIQLLFLSLNNNSELKTIPETIIKLPNLKSLSLAGSTNVVIPSKLKEALTEVTPNVFVKS